MLERSFYQKEAKEAKARSEATGTNTDLMGMGERPWYDGRKKMPVGEMPIFLVGGD